MKLRITKLDPSLTKEDLREIFEEFGDVLTVRIFKDPAGNPQRDFALVEMDSISAGERAIEAIEDDEYEGVPLQVEVFRDIIKTESGKPLTRPKPFLEEEEADDADFEDGEIKGSGKLGKTADGEDLEHGFSPFDDGKPDGDDDAEADDDIISDEDEDYDPYGKDEDDADGDEDDEDDDDDDDADATDPDEDDD